jgi:O-antigen/teichoic acid export membrane protein
VRQEQEKAEGLRHTRRVVAPELGVVGLTGGVPEGIAAQLSRNLAANIAYFLVNIAIDVFLVPYFASTLGVAAYGLIPLATSITGYVALVVQSLNTAVTRFLTVDLQRGDYAAERRVLF